MTEAERFDRLWKVERKRLRTIIFRIAKFMTPQDREDILQAAAVKVWRTYNETKGEFSTYCVNAARYEALEAVRTRNGRRNQKDYSRPLPDDLIDESPSPFQTACAEELSEAIERLPIREKRVVKAQLSGITFREIGEAMKVSESRVYQIFMQARKRLIDFCPFENPGPKAWLNVS